VEPDVLTQPGGEVGPPHPTSCPEGPQFNDPRQLLSRPRQLAPPGV